MKKINVAIIGYGNLGKSLEKHIIEKNEYNLVCIFSRRKISELKSPYKTKFIRFDNLDQYNDKIEIAYMCGGSKNDVFMQSQKALQYFNIIDCFDTHDKISEYKQEIDLTAKNSGNIAIYSCGWDPGLFSCMRLLFSCLTNENVCTFWGRGVSQGHSDAIRKINGVKNAIQYTIPNKNIIKKFKKNKCEKTSPKKSHKRLCYVCCEYGVSKKIIKKQILSMPDYFEGYKTKIKFVSENKVEKRLKKMFHAGQVATSNNTLNFSLKLPSNPDFTAKVMYAFSKTILQLKKDRKAGAYSIFDIPLCYLCDDKIDVIKKFM